MKVRFEPIGEEIDVAPEETVLDAAFRQGYNLVYGCREGQCSACKCFLLEGDVELKRYSNFALSDTERGNGYSLMCRAMPESDLVVELLHYDKDSYRLEHAITDGAAMVESLEPLTHDITRLVLRAPGFEFTPGQYVDLHVPGEAGARRSFSMANLPGEDRIELMIKRYPGGKLSGMLEGQITAGDTIAYTGPYGSMRAREGEAPILMVAGGSGMAPILSLLREFSRQGCERPVRFFYGARTEGDLFHLDEIRDLPLADFVFTPVTGRFVHEVVDEYLESLGGRRGVSPRLDVYMCGPPPMVEAAEDVLLARGIDENRIYIDKFTTSADAGASGAAGDAAPAQPIKRIGDNGSGTGPTHPGDESEREFSWYTPRKRRATLYEDVTVDTQPSVHRHLVRGWLVSFEDGRGTWDDGSTALKSTDWFDFRDPGEQWERTYYQAGNASEQQIEGAMRSAIEEGLMDDFDPGWVEFLRRFLQIPAFFEHGLWFATATIGRDALSDSVATCICLQAAMKQRAAQSLVLYAMDLEEHHGAFSIEAARQSFLQDEPWQPMRAYLEKLAATHDWGEVVIAANLCLEPIVGTLLRRELGTRAAAANGDLVTPVLARVETQEWEWVRAWTTELTRFLLDDPEHGAENRETIAGWIRTWLPQAIEAGLALMPIAEQVPGGIDVERALKRVRYYAADLLAEAGVPELGTMLGVEPVERSAPDSGHAGPESEKKRRVRSGKAVRSRVAVRDAEVSGPPPPPPDDEGGAYDYVGIVMAKSAEGDAVAAILRQRSDIHVYEQPAFWDIRAEGKLVIPYEQVSEQLGYAIDAYSIQHEMSTHYGRMVATDEALMLFSDPTEAMQYLMA
jgi:NAD(P)H-flavin reductase/ferredoxin